MACDKVVCERWCVTKLCVNGGVCGKVVREQRCVCVCERECVMVEAAGPGGGAGYRIKNKNPTQRCGKNALCQTLTR